VLVIGLTLFDVVIVNAASTYHWIADPVGQVPVKVAELPTHIFGAFKLEGAAGRGVTLTEVLADVLLQVVLTLFRHAE
jgi:hypothetical protein